MVGTTQYTLEKVIAKGANGVVWAAKCKAGSRVAIKLCDPWVARIHALDPAVGGMRKWGVATEQVVVSENTHRLKLEYYDISPSALAVKLREHNIYSQIARKGLARGFATQTIAGCVNGVPVGNGALLMPLLGPSLVGKLPLSPPLYRKLKEVLITACMSALVQGVALVDLKAANVCFADDTFVVVDSDTLPSATPGADTARAWATFTVPNLLPSTVATMLVNLVLLLAQAIGTVSEQTVWKTFDRVSRTGTVAKLAAIAPPATSHIVSALAPDMSVAAALSALGSRLPLSPDSG
ncbi:hypothetical protein [Nereida ignava]|uniref:hypothetical protein n=1 Tax=Nereida ignava TaxID=282199 RepID=UPI0030FA7B80